jgi:hypothetical protein
MTAAPEPEILEIDSEWFTVDEIAAIETMIGTDFTKFMNQPGPKAAHFKVLATIVQRRTDPEFKLEDAGSLKVSFKKTPVPPTSGNGSEHA